MLTELLDLLREGGTHRVKDLAQALDTTPQLVELMMEDLAGMGYLKAASSPCGGHCNRCDLGGMCAIASGGRIWTLTERDSDDSAPATG